MDGLDSPEAPPRISVVIPAYHDSQCIPEAIDRILSQDVGPVELVIVDDGSKQDIAAVVAPTATRSDSLARRTRGWAVRATQDCGHPAARTWPVVTRTISTCPTVSRPMPLFSINARTLPWSCPSWQYAKAARSRHRAPCAEGSTSMWRLPCHRGKSRPDRRQAGQNPRPGSRSGSVRHRAQQRHRQRHPPDHRPHLAGRGRRPPVPTPHPPARRRRPPSRATNRPLAPSRMCTPASPTQGAPQHTMA